MADGQAGKGSRVTLKKALDVLVTQDQDGWWCECDELQALGHGPTNQAAYDDMMESVADAYSTLVGSPDDSLTKDARRLRDKLTEFVEATNG